MGFWQREAVGVDALAFDDPVGFVIPDTHEKRKCGLTAGMEPNDVL